MESRDPLSPVQPVLPVAAYLGGKRNLSKRLCGLIESAPHDGYAEAFVGMGGVFLKRRARPKVEIINDWSADVATFFRVLQRHYQAFLDMIRWQITTRAEFERLVAVDPDTLTDLERAARFLYLQRLAFGGKVRGRNFGVTTTHGARFNLTKLVPMLEDVHERLAGVVIERLHFAEFLRRYDRPGMLFYLDPPYAGGEADYGKGMFAPEDFALLAELLAGLKGRFILSINDTPAIRKVFKPFRVETVSTHYGIASGQKKARELIVTGGP